MKSLKYSGPDIEEYFSTHRTTWEGFYPSERSLIESVWPTEPPHILDIGSACGGLGLALQERFGRPSSYTGIEFNTQAVLTAQILNPSAHFIEGDFLQVKDSELREGGYDLVFSLSCVDWQINTVELLKRAWETVSLGGLLILSLRLTLDGSCTDFSKSFQFINYHGLQQGEKAPYVVLNVGEVRTLIRDLGALGGVRGLGYWGAPSSTAVTPFPSVCFAVLALAKSEERLGSTWDLTLPEDVLAAFRNGPDG
jgi:SAM-dependent methyltransferase